MSCPLRFAGTVVELVLPFLDALELAQRRARQVREQRGQCNFIGLAGSAYAIITLSCSTFFVPRSWRALYASLSVHDWNGGVFAR